MCLIHILCVQHPRKVGLMCPATQMLHEFAGTNLGSMRPFQAFQQLSLTDCAWLARLTART